MTARATVGRPSARFFGLLLVLGLGAGLWSATPPAHAQGRDRALEALYTVAGVPVDATADSAVTARETARQQGETVAFGMLVERLVPAEQRGSVPVPQGEALTNMINSFEVDDERTSAVRYLGRYTFHFDPGAMRAHLGAAGVQAVAEPAPRALVLPVLDLAGGPVLWAGANSWLEQWQVRPPVSPMVPMDLPLGDLQDITAVDAASAIAGIDPAALQTLLTRYDAPRLVTLALHGDGTEVTANDPLTIRVIQQVPFQAPQEVVQGVPPADSPAERLALAARVAADAVASLSTAGVSSATQFAQLSHVSVSVPISGLADWVNIRRRILGSGAPSVALRALTVDMATVDLGYSAAQPLVAGLDQQGLMLVQADGFPVHPAMAGEAHLRMGPLTLRRR
jgi:hypothetical protein